MCQKCALRSKNLGPPKTLTAGQVRFFARQLNRNMGCIPLHHERRARIAIEAQIWRINQRRTDRSKYNRRIERQWRYQVSFSG
jgi:hypothetical protein